MEIYDRENGEQTHPNHYLSSSGSLIEKIECI